MAMLDEIEAPDMVLMSPGPGCPKDFKTAETLKHLLDRQLPIFGVCLGLQVLCIHAWYSVYMLGTLYASGFRSGFAIAILPVCPWG